MIGRYLQSDLGETRLWHLKSANILDKKVARMLLDRHKFRQNMLNKMEK
jgi:hypothetical protein